MQAPPKTGSARARSPPAPHGPHADSLPGAALDSGTFGTAREDEVRAHERGTFQSGKEASSPSPQFRFRSWQPGSLAPLCPVMNSAPPALQPAKAGEPSPCRAPGSRLQAAGRGTWIRLEMPGEGNAVAPAQARRVRGPRPPTGAHSPAPLVGRRCAVLGSPGTHDFCSRAACSAVFSDSLAHSLLRLPRPLPSVSGELLRRTVNASS